MVNSLRFRMEADNAHALRGVNQMSDAVKRLGHEIQGELGKKLQTALTVTFIEEAIRRTGEWSTEILRTSEKLGVTAESLQALRIAAEHAGVAEEKVFTFANKMEVAMEKAARGTTKMQDSLRKLGLTSKDWMGGPGGMTAGGGLIKALNANMNASGMGEAMENVFGTKGALDFRSFSRVIGGNFDKFQEGKSPEIAESNDLKDISRAFQQIWDDTKSIALKLLPIAQAVLAIVDGVLKMVNGLVGSIKHVLTHNPLSDESVMRSGTIVRGLANYIPQTGAGIFNLGASILGAKKRVDWKLVQSGREAYGDALGADATREAEGAAEGLGTIATFGVGPIAKGLGLGGKAVSAGASFTGMDALGAKAGGMAGRLGKFGAGEGLLREGWFGMAQREVIEKFALDTMITEAKYRSMAKGLRKRLGVTARQVRGKSDKSAFLDLLSEEILGQQWVKVTDFLTKEIPLAGALSSAGGIGKNDIDKSDLFRGSLTAPNRGGMAGFGGLGGVGAGLGNNSNLSIGGVLGVDIQAKMLALTDDQNRMLAKIMQYTGKMAGEMSGEEETVPN